MHCLCSKAAFFSLVLFAAPAAQAADPIRIGVSTPLTGDAATYGTDIRNVLEFANNTIAHGRYKLIFQDDRCDAKEAVAVATKFAVNDGLQYVLGVVCTDALKASAPIYSKSDVMVITPTANLDDIKSAGLNVFTTVPSDTEAMKPLAEYACSRHKTIAVIAELTEMPQQMAKKFESLCPAGSAKVIRGDFQPKEQDFRTLLLGYKNAQVDAVFIDTQTEAAFLSILKQLRQLHLNFAVYGALFPGTAEFLEKAGSAAEGIRYVDLPNVSDALNPEGRRLYEDYVKQYGRMKSIEFLFISAYESFRALHLAIDSGQNIREFLTGGRIEGLSGAYSFGSDGVISGITHSMKIIRSGKPEKLE